MHCYICDNVLTEDEIKEEPHTRGGYAPCRACINAAAEYAVTEEEEGEVHNKTGSFDFDVVTG